MFRVVPAVFVSKRNDEIAIARAPGLAQASRDFGFDTIYDLLVERHVIAGKIDGPRGCLRHIRGEKKREQSEEPARRGFHRRSQPESRKLRKEKEKGPDQTPSNVRTRCVARVRFWRSVRR